MYSSKKYVCETKASKIIIYCVHRYMSQIDKALKAFEYTTEWADLIAALEKLNKVLLAHQKYPIIPRRIVISKRLQQCMHHALPSGVHLKAGFIFVQNLRGILSQYWHLENCIFSTPRQMPQTITNIPRCLRRF